MKCMSDKYKRERMCNLNFKLNEKLNKAHVMDPALNELKLMRSIQYLGRIPLRHLRVSPTVFGRVS